MARTLDLTDDLHDYVVAHSTLPDPALTPLAERTAALGDVVRPRNHCPDPPHHHGRQ